MTSNNLINIYAFIKEKFPDYDVLYAEPPSYIKRITNSEQKVIFIFKNNPTKNNHTDIDDINENVSTKSLDLTGSPLKDSIDINNLDISSFDFKIAPITPWTEFEENISPINLQKARSILNDFSIQKEGRNSKGSLWILCDATEDENTVLLEYEFKSNFFSRGIVHIDSLISPNSIEISNLVKKHFNVIPDAKKLETNIDCYFHIRPTVILKLSWNSLLLNPSLNNFKKSDVILFQTIKIDDDNCLANSFWRQLYVLSIIKDDIIDIKENTESNCKAIFTCGGKEDIDNIKEKILAALTEIFNYNYDNTSEIDEIEAVIQKAKLRPTMEVTDKLWEILKCCSSYKDLKSAFHFVFQCAAQCNVVNMPTNQNHLAEIIRKVSQQRLAIPCLVGSEPLELLLEIGLEKLSKDYEYIFSESKICSVNDLQLSKKENLEKQNETYLNVRKSLRNALTINSNSRPQRFTLLHCNNDSLNKTENLEVGFQNSNFNNGDIEYKFAKLAQTHIILEHLLSIQVYLNLENVHNEIFGQLVQRPLLTFDELKSMVYDNVEIPIQTEKVLYQLENKEPHARRIQMSSKTKFREVITTYYFNMDNIFPPNVLKNASLDDNEFERDNMYYSWTYTKISTIRP